jgi:hypothetical protein
MGHRLSRESARPEDLRLIAVELAVIDDASGVNEELQMFACDHTLVGFGARRAGLYPIERYGRLNLTVHTSNGDLGAQIQLA